MQESLFQKQLSMRALGSFLTLAALNLLGAAKSDVTECARLVADALGCSGSGPLSPSMPTPDRVLSVFLSTQVGIGLHGIVGINVLNSVSN